MDFTLSTEHLQVQQMVREFAQREVAPIIKDADRDQQMPAFILPRLAELGLLGLCIPVKYGGQGMDYISLGLACEELDAVDTGLRTALSVHVGLNSLGLLQWATEEQKRSFLTPQARGEQYAAFGLTEPGAGSDVAAMSSTARRQNDNYIINGEKMWISLANEADNLLWFAKTEPDDDIRGITAFLIKTNQRGVTRGNITGKLGLRTSSTGWVSCQDVHVPVSHRIGEEGEGFKIAMACIDNGRYTVGSGCVGLIRAALQASVKYSRERHAFGQEIGKFQLIQQKIASMTTNYEIGRLMYMKVGWMKNMGLRNTRETSQLKWYASEAAFEAANQAIQIHGAYGYSDEYDVERYMRNARVSTIYEGTSEVHQLMQAGYALGYRQDGNLRCELPKYDRSHWHTVS